MQNIKLGLKLRFCAFNFYNHWNIFQANLKFKATISVFQSSLHWFEEENYLKSPTLAICNWNFLCSFPQKKICTPKLVQRKAIHSLLFKSRTFSKPYHRELGKLFLHIRKSHWKIQLHEKFLCLYLRSHKKVFISEKELFLSLASFHVRVGATGVKLHRPTLQNKCPMPQHRTIN